jgi:hypothetical protein
MKKVNWDNPPSHALMNRILLFWVFILTVMLIITYCMLKDDNLFSNQKIQQHGSSPVKQAGN